MLGLLCQRSFAGASTTTARPTIPPQTVIHSILLYRRAHRRDHREVQAVQYTHR